MPKNKKAGVQLEREKMTHAQRSAQDEYEHLCKGHQNRKKAKGLEPEEPPTPPVVFHELTFDDEGVCTTCVEPGIRLFIPETSMTRPTSAAGQWRNERFDVIVFKIPDAPSEGEIRVSVLVKEMIPLRMCANRKPGGVRPPARWQPEVIDTATRKTKEKKAELVGAK